MRSIFGGYIIHSYSESCLPFYLIPSQPRRLNDPSIDPAEWLTHKIKVFEDEATKTLVIPLKDDGSEYSIDDLYNDQQEIVTVVVNTLYDFLYMEDLSLFKPLRIIINGQGGSGKSVVINTIVTIMRKMFDTNDVVKVCAPTGVAAYNVNGETFHHLFKMGVTKKEYKSDEMPQTTRMHLIKKFKTLLALIIDERSLVSSRILGTVERKTAETIYEGGHNRDQSWGGLPIVVIVGDDYQLPGIGEGPLTALFSRYGSKMTYNGRKVLLEASEVVMELGGSKRVRNDQSETKELLNRLRLGTDILEKDVQKLQSLHLDKVGALHGPEVVKDIEDRAMYLFYRNDKRKRHNMEQLIRRSSPTNPVAVIRSQSAGTLRAKGYKSHFDSDIPNTALMCIDAKVAINSRNFMPSWGLHNGACGIAREIIFSKGHNPNNGDNPLYVVIEFPLYCGPAWDRSSPKVSYHSCPYNFQSRCY